MLVPPLLLMVLTVAVMARDPLPAEEAVLTAVHADDPGWQRWWQAVSDASNTEVLAAVVAVVCVGLMLRHRTVDAVPVAVAFGAAWVLVVVLKAVVARPRPAMWPQPADVSAHGYPSGHAAASAALVGALLLVLRRVAGSAARAAAAVTVGAGVVVLVGAAQVVLGRHYPSDVLAGWLLAAACLSPWSRPARAPAAAVPG